MAGHGRAEKIRGAPLAFLSRLKLPFPPLSNACDAGYVLPRATRFLKFLNFRVISSINQNPTFEWFPL